MDGVRYEGTLKNSEWQEPMCTASGWMRAGRGIRRAMLKPIKEQAAMRSEVATEAALLVALHTCWATCTQTDSPLPPVVMNRSRFCGTCLAIHTVALCARSVAWA